MTKKLRLQNKNVKRKNRKIVDIMFKNNRGGKGRFYIGYSLFTDFVNKIEISEGNVNIIYDSLFAKKNLNDTVNIACQFYLICSSNDAIATY